MLVKWLLPLSLLVGLLYANPTGVIKSTSGNIIFDIDEDDIPEARLNSTGLAIGTDLQPTAKLHVAGNIVVTNDLLLGSNSGNSNFEVAGSMGFNMQTITTNTTLSGNSVVLVDTSSANLNLILPDVFPVKGRQYIIKKTTTVNHILLGSSDNLIDGYSGYMFTSGNMGFMNIVSNGSTWDIITTKDTIKFGQWNPTLIETELWLDASDSSTISHNSGNVTQWNDKSGNNRHATQGTVALQPLTSANTIGGLNTISFVSEDVLNLANNSIPSGNNAYSIYIVANITKRTDNFNMIIGSLESGAYNMLMMINASGQFYSWWNSGGPQDLNFGVAPTDDQDYIISTDYDYSQRRLFLDGVLSGSSGGGTNRNSGTTTNYLGGDGSINWSIMRIGEVLVLSEGPTQFERERLEGYLAHKWGLTANLPASHPFKTEAP